MTILELIQAQCRAIGVPEKYAEKIQKLFKIEKEEGLGSFVQMFKDNILPDIVASDNAAKKAKEDVIAEYEKTHKIKNGKPVEEKKPEEVDLSKLSPEVKAIIEAQAKQLETLTGAVTNLAKSQQNSTKLEEVKAKMKGKIDDEFIEEYAGRVSLEAENLDSAIEEQVNSYTALSQKFINKAVKDGNYVPAATGGIGDPDFKAFMDAKTKDSDSGFAAKEL